MTAEQISGYSRSLECFVAASSASGIKRAAATSEQVSVEESMSARMWVVSFLVVCLAALTGTAMADSSLTWNLVGSNGAPPCTVANPCGQVTLDVSGNNATFTVTSLFTGWVFDKFGFNTASGVPALTFVGASGEVGAGAMLNGPGSFTEDGFGKFTYEFLTGETGGANGGDCGGKSGGCTFTLKLSSTTALTLADFEVTSMGGSGSGFFAGHEATSNNSGYAGDTQQVQIPISEPAALAVVVPGLLVAFGQFRRRLLF